VLGSGRFLTVEVLMATLGVIIWTLVVWLLGLFKVERSPRAFYRLGGAEA
jgi:hypothetical protein